MFPVISTRIVDAKRETKNTELYKLEKYEQIVKTSIRKNVYSHLQNIFLDEEIFSSIVTEVIRKDCVFDKTKNDNRQMYLYLYAKFFIRKYISKFKKLKKPNLDIDKELFIGEGVSTLNKSIKLNKARQAILDIENADYAKVTLEKIKKEAKLILTEREHDCLMSKINGEPVKETAKRHNLSVQSVYSILKCIAAKLREKYENG